MDMQIKARLEELRKKKQLIEERKKKTKEQMKELNRSTELAKSKFSRKENLSKSEQPKKHPFTLSTEFPLFSQKREESRMMLDEKVQVLIDDIQRH